MAVGLLTACTIVPPRPDTLRVDRIEDAVLPMASAALAAGQVETARRLYTRLLDVDADSVEARMGLGDVAMAVREPGQAANWYLAAVGHARQPAERHAAVLAHGRAALTGGDLAAARASFERLTAPREYASRQDVAWGFNGIGIVSLLEGDPRAAVAAMEQALLRIPGESRFQANLERALKLAAGYTPPAGKPDAPESPTAVEPDRVAPRPPTLTELLPDVQTPPVAVEPEPGAAQAPAVAEPLPDAPELPPPPEPEPRSAPVSSPATEPGPVPDLPPQPKPVAEPEPAPLPAAAPALQDQPAPPEPSPVSEPIPEVEPPETLESLTAPTRGDAPDPPAPADLAVLDLSGAFIVRTEAGAFVQVGAYAEEAGVAEVAARLRAETRLPVRVDAGGDGLFRVRIGPVPPELLPEPAPQTVPSSTTDGDGRADAVPPVLVVENASTYVQIGTYPDYDTAAAVAGQHEARTGHPAQISKLSSGGTEPVYRVQIGPVDPDAASRLIERLSP